MKPWNDQVPDRHVPPSLQTPAAFLHGTAPEMPPGTGNAWASKEMPWATNILVRMIPDVHSENIKIDVEKPWFP